MTTTVSRLPRSACRAAVLLLLLSCVAQLHAQPLDTLYARVRSLPLDSLLQRERTTTDPRTKWVLSSKICSQYLFLDRPEECMRTALAGLGLAEQLKNDTMLSRGHMMVGNAFALVNNMSAALDRFNTAFGIAERAGDSLSMGFLCKETAVMYSRFNDCEGTMRYMRRALTYGMSPSVRARGMSIMARCYIDMGQLDSALYCAQEADIVKEPHVDPYGYSAYQGTLAAVYAARKEPDLAEPYYKRAVVVADSFHLPLPFTNAAAGYAKLLIEQGRMVEALAWARKGYKASERTRQPRVVVGASNALAEAFHANGMDDSAFVYSQQSNAYRDTLTATQNKSQMQSRVVALEMKGREEAQQRAEAAAVRSRNIALITLGGALLLIALAWSIHRGKKRTDALLLNILPAEVAKELKAKGQADARHFDQVTILFTDFKDFTVTSERLTPQDLVEELNTCFKAFDRIITAHGIEKIKTIGDAYMCAGGLPDPKSGSPRLVVQAALEMQDFMTVRKTEREVKGKPAFVMRVGIHTGPVVAGIVGVKKFQYDIWGDTVNTASRMESSGEVGLVNISEATYALVKNESSFFFSPRGKVEAKGKGALEMYFVRRSGEPRAV